MGQKAAEGRIKRFRSDMELLKEKYDNVKMAQLLGIDPGNLSSYYTGKSKNPGEVFLNKFYVVFGEELKQFVHLVDESTFSEESLPENEDLRLNLFKIVETNQILAQSNLILAQNNQTLVETNQRMMEAHLSLLEKQRKREQ